MICNNLEFHSPASKQPQKSKMEKSTYSKAQYTNLPDLFELLEEVANRSLSEDARYILESVIRNVFENEENENTINEKEVARLLPMPAAAKPHRNPFGLGILGNAPVNQNLTLLALDLANQKRDREIREAYARKRQIEMQDIIKRQELTRIRSIYATFRSTLPIYGSRDQLLHLVKHNQVVVVLGETGSGKTTQITQYLFEAGYGRGKKIVCTQPRRISAKSVARRVADEFETELGHRVGYQVRFDTRVDHKDTVIIYMTDGILVQQLCSFGGREIDRYSVIMLDEAHERTIHTDVAMGLLKEILRRRPDLKVLVTSAALDADRFSRFFGGAPILRIPGRGFPIEINYSFGHNAAYVQSAIATVIKIHLTEPEGDILVFLTGEDEIEHACKELACIKGLLPMPLYSAMPLEMQNAVFQPPPNRCRKVIFSTNLAETSVTIDGIVFVVDSGYMKQKEYNPRTGIDGLVVRRISKAQAIQRAGRAGRTCPGKVFRLYTEDCFKKMARLPVPEIQRSNVESVILQLASMGITDILRFKFMDPPLLEAVTTGLNHLINLRAIQPVGPELEITQIGQEISGFPLDPSLAKVLIRSQDFGCSEEMLIIVSLLSTATQQIFCIPKKNSEAAREKMAALQKPEGDHITLLHVHREWTNNTFDSRWCLNNYIIQRRLEEGEEIRKQLKHLMAQRGFKIQSCGTDYSKIQQALCTGYFGKIAVKTSKGHSYLTYASVMSNKEEAFIHPSSSVFKSKPQWILYHEVLQTKKVYMRNVIEIQPKWMREQNPIFYQKLLLAFPELHDMLPFEISHYFSND